MKIPKKLETQKQYLYDNPKQLNLTDIVDKEINLTKYGNVCIDVYFKTNTIYPEEHIIYLSDNILKRGHGKKILHSAKIDMLNFDPWKIIHQYFVLYNKKKDRYTCYKL